ncbi:hypothetical protein N7456_003605 [Penicillium angulare]|uniref:Amino acid transporter transmembrane domain-containing protein n=1 Tax=Penicillium angulare TaxID=116970 RepID=A0A9W9FUY3_9EURO|nr:hypothetical protein N7456_003605 [Penicillium angulare]
MSPNPSVMLACNHEADCEHGKEEFDHKEVVEEDTFGDEEFSEVVLVHSHLPSCKFKAIQIDDGIIGNVACVRSHICMNALRTLTYDMIYLVMVAETISLGILSLPAVIASIGLLPSMILIVFLGIAATYTGYSIGQFKWRYPQVQSMADAGEVLGGTFGRELLGIAQLLLLVFIMASHTLTFSVAMNAITDHGTCSIVFSIVGAGVSFACCIPRTSGKISYLSIASFISIFATVMVTMISVGTKNPDGFKIHATMETDLSKAFLAVCNIVFAYAAHVAFFGFMAELKDVRDFPKSLYLLQGTDTVLYLITSAVIYRFAGVDVASPAVGSAGPLLKKVAYGLALPTILIAGVVNGHVASKYVYLRIFKDSDRIHKCDFVAVGSWIAIGAALWTIAWVIAEAIPVFGTLLSLIAALFASWFTYGIGAVCWLHLNKGTYLSSFSKMILTFVNIALVAIAGTICVLGLYSSGKALRDDTGSGSFSCRANVS